MSRLSIWSIRIALICLVAGWVVGAVLMINRAWGLATWPWRLIDLHVALVLFGWKLQFVIAVAYWMLPTFGGRSNRGREGAAALSVVAINAGILWTAMSVPLGWTSPLPAAAAWLIAVLAFGWHAWPRIKAFGE